MTSTAATGADGAAAPRRRAVVALVCSILLVAGCAAQQPAPASPRAARPSAQRPSPPRKAAPPLRQSARRERGAAGPCDPGATCLFADGSQDSWWTCFRGTVASLREEIRVRDAALKSGPIGERARQLASLRLALAAFDLSQSGARDAARETVARAIDLDRENGYAWLLAADLHHRVPGGDGRRRANEAVREAARHLPRERSVRCELDAVQEALGLDGPRP